MLYVVWSDQYLLWWCLFRKWISIMLMPTIFKKESCRTTIKLPHIHDSKWFAVVRMSLISMNKETCLFKRLKILIYGNTTYKKNLIQMDSYYNKGVGVVNDNRLFYLVVLIMALDTLVIVFESSLVASFAWSKLWVTWTSNGRCIFLGLNHRIHRGTLKTSMLLVSLILWIHTHVITFWR